MNRSRTPDALDALIDAVLDGTADGSQWAALCERLQTDAGARRQYRRAINLDGALRQAFACPPNIAAAVETPPVRTQYAPPDAGRVPRSSGPRRGLRRSLWIVLSLAMVCWALVSPRPGATPKPGDRAPFSAIAITGPVRILEVDGPVELVEPDGEVRQAVPDATLGPRQTVRTGSDGGRAVVSVGGRRIEFAGEILAHLLEAPADGPAPKNQLYVERGAVHVGQFHVDERRSRTSAGDRLDDVTVRTPHAAVSSKDHLLDVYVSRNSTRVGVENGSAEVTRHSDRQSVSVPEGSWVTAGSDSEPMVPVRQLSLAPDRTLDVKALSAALAPDGALLAVFTGKSLELWDVTTGGRTAVLDPSRERVRQLSFSRDGGRLACAGVSPFLQIWDVPQGVLLRTIDPPPSPGPAAVEEALWPAFSDDGSILAAVQHRLSPAWRTAGVFVWNAENGEPHFRPADAPHVMSVAVVPGTPSLVGGTRRGDVIRWDARTGTAEANFVSGQKKPVKTLVVSQDGRRMAHPSTDATLVWDVSTQQILWQLDGAATLALSPDGRRLAAANLGYLDLWDLETGQRLYSAPTDRDLLVWMSFTPDGRTLVTLSGRTKRIQLWSSLP